MKKNINIQNWKRKEHFEFFSQFDEPFFGIVSDIDCTIAYHKAKEQSVSFFLYYLHKSLAAANLIEEFRYRIDDNNVICYDKIHASATIDRGDETFGFSFMEYKTNFADFAKDTKQEMVAVKKSAGLRLIKGNQRTDVIHFSSVPWFHFTGLTHARNFSFKDSVPKITFGKFYMSGEKKMLPISINAHHGLMDGIHVGKYLKVFQELLNG